MYCCHSFINFVPHDTSKGGYFLRQYPTNAPITPPIMVYDMFINTLRSVISSNSSMSVANITTKQARLNKKVPLNSCHEVFSFIVL